MAFAASPSTQIPPCIVSDTANAAVPVVFHSSIHCGENGPHDTSTIVCRHNPDQPNAAQTPGRLGCDYTILTACLLFQRAGLELYRCRCACEQIDFVVCISNSDLLKDEVIKKKKERPDREAAFHVYFISVLVSCASNFMLCKREKNNSEGHRLTGILKLLK